MSTPDQQMITFWCHMSHYGQFGETTEHWVLYRENGDRKANYEFYLDDHMDDLIKVAERWMASHKDKYHKKVNHAFDLDDQIDELLEAAEHWMALCGNDYQNNPFRQDDRVDEFLEAAEHWAAINKYSYLEAAISEKGGLPLAD